jgi:hypothetical protein
MVRTSLIRVQWLIPWQRPLPGAAVTLRAAKPFVATLRSNKHAIFGIYKNNTIKTVSFDTIEGTTHGCMCRQNPTIFADALRGNTLSSGHPC